MADMMAFDGLTVVDAMVACGAENNVLFMEETQAQQLAADVFGDQFASCLDVTLRNWTNISRHTLI